MSTTAKENILLSATSLFAEKGFEGASIRDISKKAKTNIAMVCYYFGCKENLYISCLENFAKGKTDVLKDILQAPKTEEDFKIRLQLFMQTMMATYTKDAPVLKILLREMQNERKGVTDKLMTVTNPFFSMLKDFFQASIDAKLIKKGFTADYITFIFLGALSHPCNAEVAMKKNMGVTIQDKEVQKKYSKQLLELFFNGALE